MRIEVVSPERILWSGEGEMVLARTVGGGDIVFLNGHAPFVGALQTAKLIVRDADGNDQAIAVHGGFVEVSGSGDESVVTILSDVAELADQIDVDRAKEALAAAHGDVEDEMVLAARRRAHVRLDVAGVTADSH